MKNCYHSCGLFYEQGDLFEVKDLRKTKKECWQEFCQTWTHQWHTPAISTPTHFSRAYDTIKDFMTRIKLIDPDAKFYWYCSASFNNDSNNVWWKLYALYNRLIEEAHTNDQWEEIPALIEPTVYRLEDFPYDQWKFMVLPMFNEILSVFNLNDSERWVCKETCEQCSAEALEARKIDVVTQAQRRAAERAAQQATSWTNNGNE